MSSKIGQAAHPDTNDPKRIQTPRIPVPRTVAKGFEAPQELTREMSGAMDWLDAVNVQQTDVDEAASLRNNLRFLRNFTICGQIAAVAWCWHSQQDITVSESRERLPCTDARSLGRCV